MTCVFRVKAGMVALLLLWAACSAISAVSAESQPTPDGAVTSEKITAARTEIEQANDLSADQRKLALTKLDEAQSWIEEAAKADSAVRDLKTTLQQAPVLLAQLRTSPTLEKFTGDADLAQQSAAQLEDLLDEH